MATEAHDWWPNQRRCPSKDPEKDEIRGWECEQNMNVGTRIHVNVGTRIA